MRERFENQYVVIPYSTNEVACVRVNMATGEYREEFRSVIPDRDVCFAVVVRDEDLPASILKHGPREEILSYVEENNAKIDIANANSSPMLDSMNLPQVTIPHLVFESARDNGWTLEQINKVLVNTYFIDSLIGEKDAIILTNENKE